MSFRPCPCGRFDGATKAYSHTGNLSAVRYNILLGGAWLPALSSSWLVLDRDVGYEVILSTATRRRPGGCCSSGNERTERGKLQHWDVRGCSSGSTMVFRGISSDFHPPFRCHRRAEASFLAGWLQRLRILENFQYRSSAHTRKISTANLSKIATRQNGWRPAKSNKPRTAPRVAKLSSTYLCDKTTFSTTFRSHGADSQFT